jgi:hypothetical protein
MPATKSIFKRWSGTEWIEFYFKTSADLIDETTNYKVLTADERTAISTYLTTFNAADKLVKINGAGAAQDPSKIDRTLIGDLSGSYLTVNNPTFTGTLTGNTFESAVNQNLVIKQGGTTSPVLTDGTGFTLEPAQIVFNLEGFGNAGQVTLREDEVQTGTAVLDFDGEGYITGLLNPSSGSDAANKSYVDALVATGLRWATNGPVKAASTGNIASLSGLLTIDGVTLTNGQRVLVWQQSTTSQNGIYTVSASTWSKDPTDSKAGIMVFVEGGSTYNDWTFQAITDTSWQETSRVDTITASGGLQKVGLDISVASLGITNAMLAGSITLAKLASFGSLDNANTSYDTWGELTAAATSENIDIKLKNLYAAIGLARGTTNYNTNNTETIAGAYDLAEVKNRTYTGTASVPASGTFVTGDLYFYELT